MDSRKKMKKENKPLQFNILEKALIGNIITIIVQEMDLVMDQGESYDLEVKMPHLRGLLTTFEDIVRTAQGKD